MGTLLVIKNADFSANAVEVITPPTPPEPPTPGLLTGKSTGFSVFFMTYQGASNIIQKAAGNSTTGQTKLVVYDVSQFVGETVRITSANYVINGAYYDCFASDLGNFTYDDVVNIDAHTPDINTAITVIESFNVTTTTTGAVSTVEKVIPSGAKYLCVTARFNEGLTEQDIKAIILE